MKKRLYNSKNAFERSRAGLLRRGRRRLLWAVMLGTLAALCVILTGSAGNGQRVSAEEAAEAAADPKLPEYYICFDGLTDWDCVVNTSAHVKIEDGMLTLTSGKEGASGRVQGSPCVEIKFVKTGLKALRYPYIAIRIKSTVRDLGGKLTCKAGFGKSKVDGTFEYADTDDWQTVVVDMSAAVQQLSDKSDRAGTWQDSVKLYPFGGSAGKVNAGETAVIGSIAFFKTEDSARAFTGIEGGGSDVSSGKWLEEAFKDPGASYRMMKLLYNFDNSYKATVDKLYNGYGYGGITTNVTFNSVYLKSAKEFTLLDDSFKYCLEQGMTQLWLYDEYQWPSGSAYGMVAKDDPQYEPYGLGMIEKKGSGPKVYKPEGGYSVIKYATLTSGGKTVPVRFTDTEVEISESGDWTLKVWATYDAWIEKDSLSQWQKGRPYVNIMNRDAIAKFISLTHEAYKANLTQTFGSVNAFFTDEPSLFVSNMTNPIHAGGSIPVYLVPWEDTLPEVFEQMHGYSVYEHFGSLFGGDSEEDRTVRINYYETVAKMVSENYFGQIARWCEDNGTKGSGHLLLEEKLAYHVVLYGDIMKCLNRTGYPGCDLLHVTPENLMDGGTYIGSFVAIKLASSSARNTDKEHVLVEYNPEAIADSGFKADPFGTSFAGAVITRMYGADTFVMLNPQESYNSVQARKLNECVGRLNVLLEGGKMNSGLGVYYPIAAAQSLVLADTVYDGAVAELSDRYNMLCRGLLKAGYDYNYIDDEAISNGKIVGGALECGRTSYSVIVMAYASAIDPAVLDKLVEFENAGGRLVWVEELPSASTVIGRTDYVKSRVSKYEKDVIKVYPEGGDFGKLTEKLSQILKYGYTVSGDEAVLTSPYERDGKQLIVAVNTSSAKKTVKLDFEDGRGFDVYDLYSGEIRTVSGGEELVLEPYGAFVAVKEGESGPVVEPTEKASSKNGNNSFPVIPVIAVAAGALAAGGFIAVMNAVNKKRYGGRLNGK